MPSRLAPVLPGERKKWKRALCTPYKRYVEVLTPSTSECEIILGNSVAAD